MIRSYWTIAARLLQRRPLYTVINVGGLGTAMAVCLVVGMYISDEVSADRFHDHAERIVAFAYDSGERRGLIAPFELAAALEKEIPGIQEAVRCKRRLLQLGRPDSDHFGDHRTLFTEPEFFEIFSFRVIAGDPASALRHPHAVVLAEAAAQKYFGTSDPIGKMLTLRDTYPDTSYTVTVEAVVEDPPSNSSIMFDVVAPIRPPAEKERGWGRYSYNTYALLSPGSGSKQVNARIGKLLESRNAGYPIFAIPLTHVYLSEMHSAGGFRARPDYVYLFGSLALVVLALACVNYVNLVTAQSNARAREVGVRKVLGAFRAQLGRQFLGESIIICVVSLLVAFVFAALMLPFFNGLFETELTLGDLAHIPALSLIVVLVVVVGMVSGAYPALVLSRFRPAAVLKAARPGFAARGGAFRRLLVVVQFSCSLGLITAAVIVHEQLSHATGPTVGFDSDDVVVLELPPEAWRQRTDLQRVVSNHPAILSASVAQASPMRFGIRSEQLLGELLPHLESDDTHFRFAPAVVDHDFIETLGLRPLAGRGFSTEQPEDWELGYVLNETAVRVLGWTPQQAVGQPFRSNYSRPMGVIIGVVEDFHITSLREKLEPVVLQLHESNSWSDSGRIIAKLDPSSGQIGLKHIEESVKRYSATSGIEFAFLDEIVEAQYRTEKRLQSVLQAFAGLAILIGCLGLFGLSAFTTESRTKEIGIRKVMGATAARVLGLVTADIFKLFLIACLVATPITYVIMRGWLLGFAYRIELRPAFFFLAAGGTAVVAVLTVAYHAVRAALTNPAESLRYE